VQCTVQDAEWISPDGTHCRALLISGIVLGRLAIAGMALLADYNEAASDLAGLSTALTEQLVRDGDAKGAVFI
jgi:outer membrane murein-binding lipoprotein Lpp